MKKITHHIFFDENFVFFCGFLARLGVVVVDILGLNKIMGKYGRQGRDKQE